MKQREESREAAAAMSLAAYLGCPSIQDYAGRLERAQSGTRKKTQTWVASAPVTLSAPAKHLDSAVKGLILWMKKKAVGRGESGLFLFYFTLFLPVFRPFLPPPPKQPKK